MEETNDYNAGTAPGRANHEGWLPPFHSFNKIPRYNRDVIITEKLDGTNASVLVNDDGRLIGVASRNKWIQPGKQTDNYGFAAFVEENVVLFEALGPGHHFGEWWGKGIQRGYGLDERRFSLFNTARWNEDNVPRFPKSRLHVVPVLSVGSQGDAVLCAEKCLRYFGSYATPDVWRTPEGYVIFHTASQSYFKVTLENDESHKGQSNAD